MKIIGLTGGIATGKSTVAKLFRRVGLHVIDADNVYKELSKPGNILYNKLIAEFSSAIVGKNYEIDWKKLGSMVFSDNQLRERLNSITHPAVREEIDRLVAVGRESQEDFVILEIPLLFETGYQSFCDQVVLVKTDRETQIRRLMARDDIDRTTAIQRIDAQIPMEEKIKLSDFVIDNSADLIKTEKQFYQILTKIRGI
ncbi:MAG TPA: dephospho-CoA kinase [Candidatus Izemoplasmatales bacterium]|nr:dephospho-CoA kinase [Bacillota bacterium]HRY77427.1 dephospho-CoA kinase [Candidatus Izemoplasmatales bacterium]